MKTVLETVCEDAEEARVLQEILREMGYKTSLYTQLDTDERKTPPSQTRLGDLMITYIRKNFGSRPFYVSDLEETLLAHRYSPRSTGPMLSMMVIEGTMKRLGRGQYQLMEKKNNEKLQG